MLVNTSAIACSKLGIVKIRNCCGLLYRIMTLSSVSCCVAVFPDGLASDKLFQSRSWSSSCTRSWELTAILWVWPSTQFFIHPVVHPSHHISPNLETTMLHGLFFFIFKFSDVRFKGVVECANLFHLLTWEWNRIVQLEGAFKGHLFQLHSHFGANQKSKQNNEYVPLKPFLILKNSLRAFLIMEISEESQRI